MMNEVEITKTINKCEDCPDFCGENKMDPLQRYELNPAPTICKKSGADLSGAEKNSYGVVTHPIPNTCPRLKDGREL